jgi:large conductance mechanosensitive channel
MLPQFSNTKEEGMGFAQEFKQFAMRGNVIDLAVGIVVGAAFGRIVSSFVDDVLMPPIGLLIGGVNFSELALSLREASGETAAVTINFRAGPLTSFGEIAAVTIA